MERRLELTAEVIAQFDMLQYAVGKSDYSVRDERTNKALDCVELVEFADQVFEMLDLEIPATLYVLKFLSDMWNAYISDVLFNQTDRCYAICDEIVKADVDQMLYDLEYINYHI